MAEIQKYLQITGPFGLDRRDSAIMKRNPGILYELENFLIHNGNLEVKEGNIHTYSVIEVGGNQYTTGLNSYQGGTFDNVWRVLSLFRYYGLTALEQEIKEFYAAVDGPSESKLMKWNTGDNHWYDLTLPPGITLKNQSYTAGRSPSLSNFEQFKDRVYYTNHTEPVLMIKKEDDQVYEAGIPEANAELLIDNCEALDGWQGYTNSDFNNYYLDGGFDRHTEGDYGITIEELQSGSTYKLIKTLTTPLNLNWFYTVASGTIATADPDGVKIVAQTAVFTNAFIGSWVKNNTDGSTAIITEIEYAVEGDKTSTTAYTTKLTGGTDNDYDSLDTFTIGSYSSEYDYIAIDIFRFTKIDIEEVVFEVSSGPPDANGDFHYGHRIVIYADTGFEQYDLHQRTMLAQWAINTYSNTLFQGRFRKRWFIPIDTLVGAGSSGGTLIDNNVVFPTSVIGKTIINTFLGTSGTISAVSVDGHTLTTTNLNWAQGTEKYYRIVDDWSSIGYVKVHLKNNDESSGSKEARITIDNIRLLKTPPLPAELKLQIATCDAIEFWTLENAILNYAGLYVKDDFARATEGVSCKKIPNNVWCKYNWVGTRDLSKFGTGTAWTGADQLVFDIAGQAGGILASLKATIQFVDSQGIIAQADFDNVDDWANPQQRTVYMQEFYYLDDTEGDDDTKLTNFRWDSVEYFRIKNVGVNPHLLTGEINYLYIDNIRIQPPSASKMLNKFMPIDLIIMDAIDRGIEARFGENSVIDTVVDWLFNAYAEFTRQVVGEGRVVFPDYTHGRYAVTEKYTLASLQMQVDAGGSLSITFIQNNDLTEYRDFNFNLDRFWGAKHRSSQNDTSQWWGVDWVEIPASDSDKFSIWMSTKDVSAISHIIFRFYVNAEASWETTNYFHTGVGGLGVPTSNAKLLRCVGAKFSQSLVGRRIRNDTQQTVGIVNRVYSNTLLYASDMTWDNGDRFTIDQYELDINGDLKTSTEKGFKFNILTGSLEGASGRPKPSSDNYYEYTLDVHQMFGKSFRGFSKGVNKAIKYHQENEENLEAARALLNDYGIQMVYKETGDEAGEGWWKAVITWKRGDCTPHFQDDCPWASWQCISAHEIIVRASSKKDCIVNFQDFMITKEGAVTGTQLQYKIKLEDELGYVGPSSDASYPVTVKGADVALADIYVPYDTRIKRKRLYRTDSTGNFRYLDTIGRLETTYTDQIPEELLGSAIEEDFYRPPKCAHIRKVDNRMAFIDCYDRRNTRRTSRIHLSLPFIPHQCRDADCFDLMPEDGQKSIWCEWYYGHLLVWKERSFYSIDPNTFQKTPRDLSIGCIAPLSVAAIPDGGFAWLSHEGVIFGDHTRIDRNIGEQIWPDIQGYTPQQLSHAIGWYHDRYYYIFLGYDDGIYNTRGYACYLPNGLWSYISGWNVQCVSVWKGGTDNHEVFTGTNFGYVNQLFTGEVINSDEYPAQESQITSALRTLDYDLDAPQSDKYLNWVIFHAKNLSSDPARKALLTITPYYDQLPTKALDDEQVMHTTYKKYDLCQDPGYESDNLSPTLIGFRLTGIKRYAIKGMTMDITDMGFRPFQEAGKY